MKIVLKILFSIFVLCGGELLELDTLMLGSGLVTLAFLSRWFLAHGITVKIQQGELKGTEDISRAGIPYFSFRGIPFAEAPVNDLRFQDPRDPKPWTGVRNAEKYANVCPQFGLDVTGGISGDEDCLYLNVFTPQVDAKNPGLPIIVWLHGGSFKIGAGSLYGPDYFMDKPVVVVTVNYRLGALGFLHFHDEELPGNYGLKDQIAALRWVQNNIQAFGGDRTRVTLAGQSSGTACVHWHMFSPLSKDLFHRAISQSGTAMAMWAEVPKRLAKDRGLMLARLVGCNYESARETVECLKRVPAYELIKAQAKFAIWLLNPLTLAIVPENMDESAWKSKTLDANKPWLVGFTSKEEEVDIAGLISDNATDLEDFGKNYQRLFPIVFMYDANTRIQTEKEMSDTTEKLREFYFKKESINKQTLDQLQNLWADSVATYDITEAALRHGKKTYFYVFDHLQEHSFAQLFNKDYKPTGPVHSDDLISLFKTSYFPQELNATDKHISELMINMWTNFITTGDPNSDSQGFQWSSLSGSKIEFLNITGKPEMKPWYWETRVSFWRSLNLHNESSP